MSDLPEIPETNYVVGKDGEMILVDDENKVKRPPMYHVVLLNDDYTPMDFVVELLTKVFGLTEAKAIDIMMEVHEKGEAIAATYSFDVAESRVAHVNTIAQNNQVPLRAEMRAE